MLEAFVYRILYEIWIQIGILPTDDRASQASYIRLYHSTVLLPRWKLASMWFLLFYLQTQYSLQTSMTLTKLYSVNYLWKGLKTMPFKCY